MSSLILLFHLAIAIVLIGAILLQRSEGGALGIGGGGSSGGGLSGFLKGRGQASGLVRVTIILGVIFFITSLSLSIINSYNSQSIIDRVSEDLDPKDLINADNENTPDIAVPILN
jgi:preprotein translocase subunit SecG